MRTNRKELIRARYCDIGTPASAGGWVLANKIVSKTFAALLRSFKLACLLIPITPFVFHGATADNVKALSPSSSNLLSFTYKANSPVHPAWLDNTGRQLTDGELRSSFRDPKDSKKVIHNVVIYTGGKIVVECDLAETALVESVVAYIRRPNMLYKMNSLAVDVNVAGTWVRKGRIPGFFGKTERSLEMKVENINTVTSKLRVVFDTPGYCAVRELRILGKPIKRKSKKAAGVGDSVPMLSDTKASAREVNVDDDSEQEIILENRYVRLIIDPVNGGAVASFKMKSSNKEFVHVYGGVNGRMGLLRDNLWTPTYSFSERGWSFELENNEKSAAVTLWTTGAGGMMGFTEIRKRIEIQHDAQDVRVSYKIANQLSSQTEYDYALCCHNFIGVLGEPTRYFFPTSQGVRSFLWPNDVKKKSPDNWYRNPPRSWTGFIGESGCGLGVDLDNTWLNSFYQWTTKSCSLPTFEWRYNIKRLKPGESFNTAFTLTPFKGLKRLDGVFGPVAVALDIPESISSSQSSDFTFTACASRESDISVRWMLKELPKGSEREICVTKYSLKVAEPQTRKIVIPKLARGAYLLEGVLERRGKRIGVCERAFSVDDAKLAYSMTQEGPRKGKRGIDRETNMKTRELSTEIKTPHVKWARPYAGEKPNILFIMDENGTREIIELWQRMEFDYTYDKILSIRGDRGYLYAGDTAVRDRAMAMRLLNKNLDKKCDLIVISGMEWSYHLTEKIRGKILKKVADGTGLVLISVFGADDALAAIPGVERDMKRVTGFFKWESAGDNPLTGALPWDIYPESYGFISSKPLQKSGGETLAGMKQKGRKSYPLLTTSSLGKGRVAILNYNVFTHAKGYMGYGGLLPMLSYRGGYLGTTNMRNYNDYAGANPARPNHYWEYQYALLARIAFWAARMETPVSIYELKITPQNVSIDALKNLKTKLRLNLVGKVKGGTIDVTWRDRWSNVLDRRSVKIDLSKGSQTIELPPPANARAGLNFIDVIVRNASGASTTWGAGTFNVATPLSMSGIVFPDKALPFQSISQGTMDLVGISSGDEKILLTVCDQLGREITRQRLDVSKGAKKVDFTLPAIPADISGVTIEAILLDRSGAAVDSKRVRKQIFNPPFSDRTKLRFSSWHGIWLWRSHYLFGAAAKQVGDLGLDITLNGTYEDRTGRTWDNNWHGIRITPLGLLNWTQNRKYRFPAHGFAEQSKAYSKTGDTKYLHRNPCIHDPAYLKSVDDTTKIAIKMCKRYGGVRDVCMGDEMSLTHYTNNFDFCFCPYTIKAFRKWLPSVYSSIDALNASWETKFKSWDEVMPMTLRKARKRGGNFAPWADHRTFMEVSLEKFFARINKALAKGVPGLRSGLSGTQAPVACNGMDWWRMSNAFNFFHSYNTGNSRDMRRSFARDTGVAMSPYALGYNRAGKSVESSAWNCLFSQTEGISAWTTRLFFRGDLTLSPSGRDTRDTLRELKSGIWRLIRNSKVQGDGIAIHYSQASIHAAAALGRDRAFAKARSAWVSLLLDVGLSFDFLAYAQIERGALKSGRYKVLILPESIALSDTEVREIREFVKNGGLLVADNSPGLMNSHCVPHAIPSLDALFGVRRGKKTFGVVPDGVTIKKERGALTSGSTIKISGYNPAIIADGAEALGESTGKFPVLLTKNNGRGHSVLMNMALQQYVDDRKFGGVNTTRIQNLLLAILTKAGITPFVDIRNTKNERQRCRVARYRNGDDTYLGFVTHKVGEKPEPLTIRLNKQYNVTDIRTRRNIGKTRSIRTTIIPGEARLYTLTDASTAIPPISVEYKGFSIPEENKNLYGSMSLGGELIPLGAVASWKVTAEGNRKGVRVFHIEFVTPSNETYRSYDDVVVLPAGEKILTILRRFALNDPIGNWKLRVCDITTGIIIEKSFTMKRVLK